MPPAHSRSEDRAGGRLGSYVKLLAAAGRPGGGPGDDCLEGLGDRWLVQPVVALRGGRSPARCRRLLVGQGGQDLSRSDQLGAGAGGAGDVYGGSGRRCRRNGGGAGPGDVRAGLGRWEGVPVAVRAVVVDVGGVLEAQSEPGWLAAKPIAKSCSLTGRRSSAAPRPCSAPRPRRPRVRPAPR